MTPAAVIPTLPFIQNSHLNHAEPCQFLTNLAYTASMSACGELIMGHVFVQRSISLGI